MDEAVNYIVLAIPVFFLLIGVELLVDKLRKTGYYRLNDALSNLNAGITEQVTGAFLKLFVVGLYVVIYQNLRITAIPSTRITWVLLFIGVDFFYYWFHRYAHEINFLWGGHVVHHQSEEYNLSVALRQGAFQKIGSFAFYLPLAFLGFDPVMFIVISQIQTLYQFWIHTKTIHRLPGVIEYVFNTPSHHRVHHGRNPKYIDRNHGGTLIIWDRMFGTFQREEEEVVYGITKPLNTWNPLRAQFDFWRTLFSDIAKTHAFPDKLKLLVKPPGWYPQSLGGAVETPVVTVQTAVKFDSKIPAAMNYYIFTQFVIILAVASYFLFSYETMAFVPRIIFAVVVVYSITCTGGLLELKSWSFYGELYRLISYPLTYLYLTGNNYVQSFYPLAFSILVAVNVLSILVFISLKKYFKKPS